MGLVLPQIVETKWNGRLEKWYINKGYTILKQGTKFMINVLDLSKKSGVFVQVKCDYCGKTYEIRYVNYNSIMESDVPKIACYDCRGNKISVSKTKHTIETIRKAFEEKNCTLLSTEYLGYTEYLYYICNNGHKTRTTWKDFLRGHGCRECATNENADKQRHSLEEVQDIFKNGGCKLLSNTYKNSNGKLKYICSCGNDKAEIDLSHFERGQRCNDCNETLGERKISQYLKGLNIIFKQQLTFPDCKNIHVLQFDFGVFDINNKLIMIIEYDGIQHFKPVKYFGGEENFIISKKRDEIKNKYCVDNNIPLLRIPYFDYKNIENIISAKLTEVTKASVFIL